MNHPAQVVRDTIRSLSAQRPSGLVSWSETVTGRWKVFRPKAVERHYMTLTGRSCALPKPRWVYLSPLSLLLPFSCIALIKWKCFWVSVCIELKSFQCLFSLFVSISLLPSLQSPAHSCRVSCFQRQQIAPRWPLSHFLLLFSLLAHSFLCSLASFFFLTSLCLFHLYLSSIWIRSRLSQISPATLCSSVLLCVLYIWCYIHICGLMCVIFHMELCVCWCMVAAAASVDWNSEYDKSVSVSLRLCSRAGATADVTHLLWCYMLVSPSNPLKRVPRSSKRKKKSIEKAANCSFWSCQSKMYKSLWLHL